MPSSRVSDAPGRATLPRPVRLGTSVYDLLLEKLIAREIAPGDKISVDNLVRELGVSQTPIRDALSQLEAHGLVVKTHLVGFHAVPALTPKEFKDLYEFRLLVEPSSAAKAAENIEESSATFDEYKQQMQQMQGQSNAQTFNRFAKTDVLFHSIVAKNSGNRFMAESIAATNLQFHLFRRGYNPHWVAEVSAEHDDIMDRILKGDPVGARNAMEAHLKNSHSRYKSTTTAL